MTVAPAADGGRHVCGVAPTVELHADMAARWVGESLAADLRTVWVQRPGGGILDWLEDAGVGWRSALNRGQLVVAKPEAVLGVRCDADFAGRIAAAADLVEAARGDGFRGVSVGVEASDALSAMPDVPTQLRYERAWEAFTRSAPLWLLCLFGPATARDHLRHAAAAHPRELVDPLVTTHLVDGRVLVTGEVDLSNGDVLAAHLHAAATDPLLADGDVVVDLSELDFVDVDGVRRLATLAGEVAPRRLRVLHAPRSAAWIVEATGWQDRLELAGVRR